MKDQLDPLKGRCSLLNKKGENVQLSTFVKLTKRDFCSTNKYHRTAAHHIISSITIKTKVKVIIAVILSFRQRAILLSGSDSLQLTPTA